MNALVAAHIFSALLAAGPRSPIWHREDLPSPRPATSPVRIVSLAPVVTETLFLLGRGDRVVGVTRFCDRPAQAAALEKVGGYVDISLERVLALKPDLVIAMPSLGQRALLDRLRGRGVPVLVVFGDSLDELRQLTSTLGDTLGARAAADAANGAVFAAVRALQARPLASRKAVVVVGHDPLVVAGPGTFAAEALAIAGLTSVVAADAPMWPTWSTETLSTSGVEVIIAAEGPDAAAALRALVARVVPAQRRPRVVASTRPILMRPGPALVDDLATVGALLADPP
jgi:iron complex transport system substrate-binding protein